MALILRKSEVASGQRLDISGHEWPNPTMRSTDEDVVLWSGDLATPRRTVLGVLAHIARLELDPATQREFLIAAGLPPLAFDEPDIPITLEQELACMSRIVASLSPKRSVPAHAVQLGLESPVTNFGMLGLAMMYAPSIVECVRTLASYPELCWGHARVAMCRSDEGVYHRFSVDTPMPARIGNADVVRRYLVTVDLMVAVRVNGDIFGPGYEPRGIWLPYPAPHDRRWMERALGCAIRFDAPDARILLPDAMLEATPLLANPLAFRAYERLTAQLAAVLRADVSVGEQVKRLLATHVPPPDRDETAQLMAMSSRTLTRKLATERTSYAELRREVRCARAQEYLESRELSISEVAARLGFSDATAFSRAFRAWTGQTPSSWRADEHG